MAIAIRNRVAVSKDPRSRDDAEQACVENFEGHLVSIHDQADYDKLATLTTGYTGPVLIGLYSDSAGNWQWKDGRPANMEFIMAHSYEPSQGDYGVGISNDATRSVGSTTRTAHHASLSMGGAGYDIDGPRASAAPPRTRRPSTGRPTAPRPA